MDNLLCDELLQEIFQKLSYSSSTPISLVSKRWLHLYRTSKSSLSLHFTPHNPHSLSLSTYLSLYPFLSSLSLHSQHSCVSSVSANEFIQTISSSCPNLKTLRFLSGSLSLPSLVSLSNSCKNIVSLTISLSRPLNFKWVVFFPSIKELSVLISSVSESGEDENIGEIMDDTEITDLPLENLCLSGIGSRDLGLGWLWRCSTRLKKLQLRSCEGIGDGGEFFSFVKCFKGLQEIELRACRTIVDGLLLKFAENCVSLNSLLVYDGGSREGLLQFITHCKCTLQKLDLRLPLDLDNDHLFSVANKFHNLNTLRLQSCCLVTGDGLKALVRALSYKLEEIALINCDVVERELGLLTSLSQCWKRLRKLDLSYNEMLIDKEFVSMIVSCGGLVEVKLRGCGGLGSVSLVLMSKNCKNLESVDIVNCCGIEADAVEFLVLNLPRLHQVQVEECKLSDVAKNWVSQKFIEVVIG